MTDIATGKREVTGTTVFPNLDEKAPALMDRAPRAEIDSDAAASPDLPAAGNGEKFAAVKSALCDGGTIASLAAALRPASDGKALLSNIDKRITADIETLRSAAEETAAATGQQPSVFLANLGRPSDFTARATWARSYFETGGIKAVTNNGFPGISEMISAYNESGASIACICSTDERYADNAAEAAKALKDAGARAVYLVARPSFFKDVPENDKADIHALLYKGNNMVDALKGALNIISKRSEA